MTTPILEQARQEGRKQQRESQAQIESMRFEDAYWEGRCDADNFYKRKIRIFCAIWFNIGIALTICLYEYVLKAL